MECKPIAFKGASGKVYPFHACALELALKDVGAVYALTRRTIRSDGEDFFTVVYMGQTENLGKAISKHREQLWTLEHECNSVCVHLEKDVMKRIGKIGDLEKYYSPGVEPYAVERDGSDAQQTI